MTLLAKQAGICLHITALPGGYGIGEIGAQAHRFVDHLQVMGVGVWQFLPIGPTGHGNSPYQLLSTFAGNELLIDMSDLNDLDLITAAELDTLAELPIDVLEYERLSSIKWPLLNVAATRFAEQADHKLRHQFEQFQATHDSKWLHNYALFRVLKEQHQHQTWYEWPEQYMLRDQVALQDFSHVHAESIQSSKILQFLFFRQWQTLREHAEHANIKLFGDMPIYIALDSADAWANPDLLQLKPNRQPSRVAGVPPDYFSNDGQMWGNPLYDWPKHEASGYQWWIERLEAAKSMVDLVRIDHFRGFEAYWSIPADAESAREGEWQEGPGDRLFDAFTNHFNELPIIAEDLGEITPNVYALRDKYNLPGMTVLHFKLLEDEFSIANVPTNTVIYTGTHDNDTTVGWFEQLDHDTRNRVLQRTNGSPDSIAFDLINVALRSDAKLAIVPMQDILGLGFEARFNTPGTSTNNWRWRMVDAQLNADSCQLFAERIKEAGR